MNKEIFLNSKISQKNVIKNWRTVSNEKVPNEKQIDPRIKVPKNEEMKKRGKNNLLEILNFILMHEKFFDNKKGF